LFLSLLPLSLLSLVDCCVGGLAISSSPFAVIITAVITLAAFVYEASVAIIFALLHSPSLSPLLALSRLPFSWWLCGLTQSHHCHLIAAAIFFLVAATIATPALFVPHTVVVLLQLLLPPLLHELIAASLFAPAASPPSIAVTIICHLTPPLPTLVATSP
jgi:hypothetical protein